MKDANAFIVRPVNSFIQNKWEKVKETFTGFTTAGQTVFAYKKGKDMYNLYRNQFQIGMVQFIAGILMMTIIDFFIFYYRKNVGIPGAVLCILLWNIVCLLLIDTGYHKWKASPYKNLKMRYQQESGLQEILEEEFTQAENIESKVWLGKRYVFFREEYEFKVFQKDKIYDLNIRNISIPRGGIMYLLTGKCEEYHFTISMSEKGVEYVYQKLSDL